MRKILLFIVSLFTISTLSAQNIQLLNAAGTVVNGDTITFTHYMDTAIFQSDFKHDEFVTVVNNSSTATMNIDLTREEIDIIPGSADYYCWGTQCLLAKLAGTTPFWVAMDPVLTAPNDSAGGLAPLSIYMSPRGNDGTALFKYTFTDIDDGTGMNVASVYVRWVVLDSTVYSDPVMLFKPKPRKFSDFGDSISRKVPINGDTINIVRTLNNNVLQTPSFEEELFFNVFNATSNAMQIDMVREEVSTISRSGDFFSWNGTTTPETKAGISQQSSANSAVTVEPRRVANENFSIKVNLNLDSVGGTAVYKYSYTDVNNPSNTGSFFVRWTINNITPVFNIRLLDASGSVVNEDTITFTHYMDTAITQADFKHDKFVTVVNGSSTDTMNIDLIREEIDIIPGSADYYCWGTQCLLANLAGSIPTWAAMDPVKTAPNDSAGGLAPLSIYISPRGNDGTALFKFTFTDVDDRSGVNSASVYVKWVILDTTVYSNSVMLFNVKPRKFSDFGDSISRKVSMNGDTINLRSIINNTDSVKNTLFEEEVFFNVFNATNSSMQIDMTREEVSTIPMSGDYFSWNGTTTTESKAGVNPTVSANSPVTVDPRLVANQDFSIKLYLNSDSVGGTAIYKYLFTDMNNPNNTGSLFVKWLVDDVTSIEEVKYQNEFSLYPNPATEMTTVSLEKPLIFKQQELEIFNILGEKVYSEQIASGTQIINVNVANLNSGIYFVNILGDNQRVTSKKMIVE